MNMNQNRKTVALVLGVLLVGILVGSLLGTPQAQANPVSDFFNKILTPFAPKQAPAASATSSVPLYQPVIDYETAVVNAVKKASPAVVSITISENVPVVESCPFNPFS